MRCNVDILVLFCTSCLFISQAYTQLHVGPSVVLNSSIISSEEGTYLDFIDRKVKPEIGFNLMYEFSSKYSITQATSFGYKNYLANDNGFFPIEKVSFKVMNSSILFNYHYAHDITFGAGLNYILLSSIKIHRPFNASMKYIDKSDIGLYFDIGYSFYNLKLSLAYRIGLYNSQVPVEVNPDIPIKPIDVIQLSASYLFYINVSDKNKVNCPRIK